MNLTLTEDPPFRFFLRSQVIYAVHRLIHDLVICEMIHQNNINGPLVMDLHTTQVALKEEIQE